jgi:hypothetical protein
MKTSYRLESIFVHEWECPACNNENEGYGDPKNMPKEHVCEYCDAVVELTHRSCYEIENCEGQLMAIGITKNMEK